MARDAWGEVPADEHEHWEGYVELWDVNVSLVENGLVHSHSKHEFWMQNDMNDEETFEVEYKHHLQKWNGSAYVDIVPETQDDKPQVREERQQMGQNWSNQRGLGVDGQV
ncbi:MAG: hypothetical protein OXT74_04465 [Candidatus Poribacteria bacterium]|nr:hypothetical protein [Candidatus Poribacteria bacterium]